MNSKLPINLLLQSSCLLLALAVATTHAYDLQFAYPKNTQAIAGTMPSTTARHLDDTWVWSRDCFGASARATPTSPLMGCYWYANTELLDLEWAPENDLKYMFNSTRNSTYKYLHVHIHD